jgi:ubiquinone/menaquinone biosynthesis C-methylase UbiE
MNHAVTFAIAGNAYDNFMGRYSAQLAPLFADFCGIAPGTRVLDVGCGPGALSAALVTRLGAQGVSGIDPSTSFVEACRARCPDAEIKEGPAEQLPWADATFDAALAQLVLSFVTDPVRVAHEMKRVVRPSGTVAACMWLAGTGMDLTHLFWEAAGTLDPALRLTEASMPFRRQGEIARLWSEVGLSAVEETTLEVHTRYASFEELWSGLERAAGPIGAFMAKADAARVPAIRAQYFSLLGEPTGTIDLAARAVAARARV